MQRYDGAGPWGCNAGAGTGQDVHSSAAAKGWVRCLKQCGSLPPLPPLALQGVPSSPAPGLPGARPPPPPCPAAFSHSPPALALCTKSVHSLPAGGGPGGREGLQESCPAGRHMPATLVLAGSRAACCRRPAAPACPAQQQNTPSSSCLTRGIYKQVAAVSPRPPVALNILGEVGGGARVMSVSVPTAQVAGSAHPGWHLPICGVHPTGRSRTSTFTGTGNLCFRRYSWCS